MMNVKNTIVCLAVLWLGAVDMTAQQITIDEAAQTARQFLAENTSLRQKAPAKSGSQLKLVHTARKNQSNLFYVFNISDARGFVITAADACAEPILGFSDESSFQPDSLPCCLKAWLKCYEEQIAAAVENQVRTVGHAPQKAQAAISPLLSSKWNQWSPYNDQCPVFSGTTRCATGCVATATAQIMYYYKYPTKGTGSHSYTDEIKGKNVNLSANFGNTTYQWSQMTATYSNSSTSAAKTAVATLMAHLGVATEMNYADEGQNASATGLDEACEALKNYFGYDKGMTRHIQGYTPLNSAQWEACVYDELKNKRPVLYEGNPNDGGWGHAFVIDGYSNGKYHFNFGWSGGGDGYFALNAVKPANSGVNYDFSQQQGMVIGIQKAVAAGNVTADVRHYGDLTVETHFYNRSSSDKIWFRLSNGSGFFFNVGNGLANIQLGLRLENLDTKAVSYVPATTRSDAQSGNTSLGFWDSFTDLYVPIGSFTETGRFTAVPVYRLAGTDTWTTMIQASGQTNTADILVNEYSLQVYTAASTIEKLEATFLEVPDTVEFGEPFRVTVALANRGNAASKHWYNLRAVQEGGTSQQSVSNGNKSCNLETGQSDTLTFQATIKGMEDDTYKILLKANDTHVVCSAPVVVKVHSDTPETPYFELSGPVKVVSTYANSVGIKVPYHVTEDMFIDVKSEVTNTSGDIIATQKGGFYASSAADHDSLAITIFGQMPYDSLFTIRLYQDVDGEYQRVQPLEYSEVSFVSKRKPAIMLTSQPWFDASQPLLKGSPFILRVPVICTSSYKRDIFVYAKNLSTNEYVDFESARLNMVADEQSCLEISNVWKWPAGEYIMRLYDYDSATSRYYGMEPAEWNTLTVSVGEESSIAARQEPQLRSFVKNGVVTVTGLPAGQFLSLYNLHGQLLLQACSQGQPLSLNCSHLPTGVYLLVTDRQCTKLSL